MQHTLCLEISRFKTLILVLLFGAIFLAVPIQAGIVFTGSNASPALTGETQTISGVTNIGGELNFETNVPISWYYDNGSTVAQGEWFGWGITGSAYYYGDGYSDATFSLNSGALEGKIEDGQFTQYFWLSKDSTTLGEYGTSAQHYTIGSYGRREYSLAARELHSGSNYMDVISKTYLAPTGAFPGIANYLEASLDGSGGSISLRDSYFTWHRATSLPTGSNKTVRTARLNSIASRSTLAMSFGGSSNILKINHPTDSNNAGIELNPLGGTVKVNNVPLLTQAAADSRYVASSSTGGVLFGGTLGQGTIPAEGAGTRMMWYSGKAAFRVGNAAGSHNGHGVWDNANVGSYSFATGLGTVASGSASFAAGEGAIATGAGAIALGGASCEASGLYSTALGTFAKAESESTIALGGGIAQGAYSLSMGWGTATSFGSTTLGISNVIDNTQNSEEWVETDQLLVVGNGYETGSNGLVMRKNANMRTGGTIEAKGVIRCAPGGDLSMGTFTAGNNPSTLDTALKYTGE